jgi:protein phosphatase 1 regulatory subunit 37
MLVEEEGEIFRKGQALLGPDELEGEFAGEQLRIEVRISTL